VVIKELPIESGEADYGLSITVESGVGDSCFHELALEMDVGI